MRKFIISAAAALAAFAATQAGAQRTPGFAMPALAGRVMVAGCRQGECSWLRIGRLERVSRTARGELRRLTQVRGTSRYGEEGASASERHRPPIEWEHQSRTDYIFCSRARPAYAFPDDDGRSYLIHYLDLFDLGGYQQSSALLYMRVCHNRGPAGPAALRRLGYRPGTRNEQVENARPEDMTRF